MTLLQYRDFSPFLACSDYPINPKCSENVNSVEQPCVRGALRNRERETQTNSPFLGGM